MGYSKLTREELKAELDGRSISYAKNAKTDTLIQKLQGDDASAGRSE
ncbi:hypothetical protein [Listeria fleischmannii]|nr:hypothetical protein [Listeria fleischmannii]